MRVLLVEDNPGDADRVRDERSAPSKDPIALFRFERLSGPTAELEKPSFDVILLDLALRDAVGLEGSKRLRKAAPGGPTW